MSVPPIRFSCPGCGHVYSVAAEHAGRRLSCKKCQAAITVPEGADPAEPPALPPIPPPLGRRPARPVRPPRGPGRRGRYPAGKGLGAALAILIAIVAWVVTSTGDNEYEPSDEEGLEEKYGNVREAFSVNSGDEESAPTAEEIGDPSIERQAIAKLLAGFARAHGDADGDAFVARIHAERMLADIGRHAPAVRRARGRTLKRQIAELRTGLRNLVEREGVGTFRWGQARVRRVRFHPSRPEAEVYCRIEMPEMPAWVKYRFWVIKERAWQIYDWEPISDGLRRTAVMGVLIASIDNPSEAATMARVGEAIGRASELASTERPEQALAALDRIDPRDAPELFQSVIAVLRSGACLQLEAYDRALAATDRALALREDLPAAVLNRAIALLGLQRYAGAKVDAKKYMDMTGDDAEAWFIIGASERELGDAGAAAAAFERGVASDPEGDVDNRVGLAELAVDEDPAKALKMLREACAKRSDAETFRGACDVLLDAFEGVQLLELAHDFVKKHPATADAHYYRGAGARLAGRLDDAERALLEARRLGGEGLVFSRYEYELAVVYWKKEDRESAREMSERLRAAGFPGMHHLAIATFLTLDAKADEALAELDRAFAFEPDISHRVDGDPVLAPVREAAGFASLDRSGRWSEAALPAHSKESLQQRRKGFATRLLGDPEVKRGPPPPTPPESVFSLVRYPSSVGTLAAYVTPDPGDGKRRPAVIWCHGGFGGIGRWLWRRPEFTGVFHRAGMVVFCPSWRSENDNPGRFELFYGEVDDALAAVKHVRSLPYVDPERVYVAGHSTGGTIAMLVALSTDDVRAAFSLGGAPDIGAVVGDGRGYGNTPFDWRDPKEAWLRSPNRFVKTLRTPTFWFEGEESGYVADGRSMAESAAEVGSPFHAYVIEDEDHHSIIGPVCALVAARIERDTRHTCNIKFSVGGVKEACVRWNEAILDALKSRAKAIDTGMLQKLKANKSDLKKPHKIRYHIRADHKEDLERFLSAANDQGLETDVIKPHTDKDGTPVFTADVIVTLVPDEAKLNEQSMALALLADAQDARLAGWSTRTRK